MYQHIDLKDYSTGINISKHTTFNCSQYLAVELGLGSGSVQFTMLYRNMTKEIVPSVLSISWNELPVLPLS